MIGKGVGTSAGDDKMAPIAPKFSTTPFLSHIKSLEIEKLHDSRKPYAGTWLDGLRRLKGNGFRPCCEPPQVLLACP